jgi:hypothetical protein
MTDEALCRDLRWLGFRRWQQRIKMSMIQRAVMKTTVKIIPTRSLSDKAIEFWFSCDRPGCRRIQAIDQSTLTPEYTSTAL